MNCLAFDVGGTNVKYGLIDKVVDRKSDSEK